MLQRLVVHLLLAAVYVSFSVASASEVAGPDSFTEDGQERQQDVSPWVLPQWWWLSSVLSLPQDHTSHATTTKTNQYLVNAVEEEDSTLSLVLPAEGNGENDKVRDDMSRGGSSAATRVGKRSRPCRSQGKNRCRRGLVNLVPASEVHQSWKNDYLSVPEALVQFSQEQTEETVCKDLSVQLFRVDLAELQLEPYWVRQTAHLGMCPSKLQTRKLGDNVWPNSVVETKCMCQRELCSNEGGDFRCQAVRRPIRTWVRHMDQFMPTEEMVSVGCVCAQKTSPEGNYARIELHS
ncbi:uncharacterized protein LOC121853563 [Homarus americanus]|uniref:uncharacterized protein LOC121853563 n=1 Tax=Homarus americanus TaxID=6706 RepID=UPI001C473818|nr:uncharacterized protein LOC121853563 [Homarus americanus]